jgi:hypothetical protein
MRKKHTAYTVPPFNTLDHNLVKGILLPTLPTFPYSTHKVGEGKKINTLNHSVKKSKERYIKRIHVKQSKQM